MKTLSALLCLLSSTLQGTPLKEEPYLEPYLTPYLTMPLKERALLQGHAAFVPKLETAPIKEPKFLSDRGMGDLVPLSVADPKSFHKEPEAQVSCKVAIQEAASSPMDTHSLPKLPLEELSATLLPETGLEEGHNINFNDVPMEEFIRFVSKISHVNFIFDKKALDFNVSLTSGKAVSAHNVLTALLRILRLNGFWIKKEDEYFVIHKIDPQNPPEKEWDALLYEEKIPPALVKGVEPQRASQEGVEAAQPPTPAPQPLPSELIEVREPYQFFVFKLKYHQGAEIKEALKQVALEMQTQPGTPQKLLSAIHTVQWVKATNSLLCSGDEETIAALKRVIESLDTALKQVFIEVLVIETDLSKGLEFGLQWAGGGKLKNGLGVGAGGFSRNGQTPPFAQSMQGIDAANTPSGLGQFPVGSGFDLGVIGDVIFHKGRSFFSLGALVSALQEEGGSTIVLNQKIIAQDNKPSRIFVGENIPFTGSVTQLVGQNQQTTSNIEYRDIGVNLNITPMLGDDGVITLDLQEEISETVNQSGVHPDALQASGIRTTRTNMVTHVHVPDKHFLVLSGMIRNAQSEHKEGLPCLGGIPYFGALFSKKMNRQEKRNVIIFVRPHIVQSVEDYKKVSSAQRELHRSQGANHDAYDAGMRLIPPIQGE